MCQAGKTPVSYEPLSVIEVQNIREQVELFLDAKGQEGEIEVGNEFRQRVGGKQVFSSLSMLEEGRCKDSRGYAKV